ncbi:sigma-70 family RNA polymerase sigma factor [Haliangium sp.]|uniref:sigma-70 family RNA polymerase sigma factor n=1 Tax=Haliangium sp. TaxID=2663208 RepID=UPI003D10BED1
MPQRVEDILRHRDWLYRLAMRMVRSQATADDLVQDTMLVALEKAPAEPNTRSWMGGVMRNLARLHVRTEVRRTRRELATYESAPSTPSPEDLVLRMRMEQRLGEAVLGLPEPFRTTILQRFMEGRSAADIARREQIPAGTIRWRQKRALDLLRTSLTCDTPSGAKSLPMVVAAPVAWWTRPIQWLESATQAVAAKKMLLAVAAAVLIGGAGVHQCGVDQPQDERGPSPPQATAAMLTRPLRSVEVASTAALSDWLSVTTRDVAGDPVSGALIAVNGQELGTTDERGVFERRSLPSTPLPITGTLVVEAEGYWPARTPYVLNHRVEVRLLRPAPLLLARLTPAPLLSPPAVADAASTTPRSPSRDSGPARPRADRGGWSDGTCTGAACGSSSPPSSFPGRPVCSYLQLKIATLSEWERNDSMSLANTSRFVMGMLVAHIALASQLGCDVNAELPSDVSPPISTSPDGLPPGATAPDDPSSNGPCSSELRADGLLCTTCIDDAGVPTELCLPADCVSEQPEPGLVCTTCSDAAGNVLVTCDGDGDPTIPGDCHTEIRDGELVCTVCIDPATGIPQEDCQPGVCMPVPRDDGMLCTVCIDPAGQELWDCPSDDPPPADCYTEIRDGLVCTICIDPATGMIQEDCQPGECTLRPRDDGVLCTVCIDPAGQEQWDCPAGA